MNYASSIHYELLCAAGILSAIGNLFVMYLIIYHTRSQIGHYKYLLMVFAIFCVLYSGMHIIVGPLLHLQGNIYLVIYDGIFIDYLSRDIQHHLSIVYCGFFSQYLVIVAYHFLYRYISICKFTSAHIFHDPRFIAASIFFYIGVAIVWQSICTIFLPMTDVKDAYVEERYRLYYNGSIQKHGYTGPLYRTSEGWNILECVAMAAVSFILVACTGAIVFASTVIYKLTYTKTLSRSTRSLHKQLFKVLLVQCALPLLTAHGPAFFLFLAPIIGWNIDFNIGYYMSLSIALFPAIDPFALIYIFKDYRRATIRLLLNKYVLRIMRRNTVASSISWINTGKTHSSTERDPRTVQNSKG